MAVPGLIRRFEAAVARRPTLLRALLACGVLASLHYGWMITFIRFEGYSALSQTVSELTAIGAPTRALWALLGPVYNVLLGAFGLGVWVAAHRNRPLRVVAGLLLAFAALVFVWPFAAMHTREVLAAGGGTFSDTLHVIAGGISVVLMLATVGVGSAVFGRRFRLYSLATLAVLLLTGVLTGLDSPRMAADLPTPWLGLWERLAIATFLVWTIVLAVALLRTPRTLVSGAGK